MEKQFKNVHTLVGQVFNSFFSFLHHISLLLINLLFATRRPPQAAKRRVYTKHYTTSGPRLAGCYIIIIIHIVNVQCRCDEITVAAGSSYTTLSSPRAQ